LDFGRRDWEQTADEAKDIARPGEVMLFIVGVKLGRELELVGIVVDVEDDTGKSWLELRCIAAFLVGER
jgi:hypothetical protein